jgi:hypothetical protein
MEPDVSDPKWTNGGRNGLFQVSLSSGKKPLDIILVERYSASYNPPKISPID